MKKSHTNQPSNSKPSNGYLGEKTFSELLQRESRLAVYICDSLTHDDLYDLFCTVRTESDENLLIETYDKCLRRGTPPEVAGKGIYRMRFDQIEAEEAASVA